ncbi:MAG: hypothetical protein ACLTDR_04025 [Adlercreutzia equolifaciens]
MTLPAAASYEKQYAAGMEALEARKEAEAAAARAAEEAAAAESRGCREGRRGVVHGLPRSGSRGRRSGA